MSKRNFLRKIGISALSLLTICTSCTDLVTNEKDSIVITSTGSGATSTDPTALLASSYVDLRGLTDQANIYALYTHTTDELIPPTRGTDWGDNGVWRNLYNHQWDATHSQILASWNAIHQNAYKDNQILAAASITPQQAAEAKFLRAFWMWHAMDLFGQVPFRNVTDGVNVNPKVLSRSEAFDFIEKDLTEALPDLPNTGPTAKNETATQAAANALLARLYLNKAVYKAAAAEGPYTFDAADMNKVIAYCDAVTNAGYSLESDYFTNFTKSAANEVILTANSGNPQNRWMMTLHYDQNPSGWNGFATLADFYAKFEDGDSRKGKAATPDGSPYSGLAKGFLVGPQLNDDGVQIFNSRQKIPLAFTTDVPFTGAVSDKGIRVIKYHPKDAGEYILLRYADVYLMKAEAIFRGGTSATTALTMVNDLRNIRGASPLATLDASTLLDERGRELYWEGYRRVDLVRFGAFTNTWQDKTNTDGYRVLFPIPQQAIDSNPNLKQNPGYSGS